MKITHPNGVVYTDGNDGNRAYIDMAANGRSVDYVTFFDGTYRMPVFAGLPAPAAAEAHRDARRRFDRGDRAPTPWHAFAYDSITSIRPSRCFTFDDQRL